MSLPLSYSLCILFFTFISSSLSPTLTHALQTPLVAPISKDSSTQLYTLSLYLHTPPIPITLHLHLGSSFTWLLCSSSSSSSSSHYIPCNSSLCSSFPSATCSNNTCSLFPENPITRTTLLDTALIDTLALSTSSNASLLHIPDFIFSCATPSLLHGLAHDATGLAALGRSNHSLPAQITSAFSYPHSFSLCLPAFVLFGSTAPPYTSNSNYSLSYTPLVVNPVGNSVITDNGQPSDEYFVNVTSIRINGKAIPINSSILAIDQNGFGGTKISTAEPYTVLETSIYKSFVHLFVNQSEAFNLTVTEAVEPFGVCYAASGLTETRVGPAVPTVDLVMHSDDVFWRVFGGNSMVRVQKEGVDVWCLGFVDGGTHRRTPVVIGGYQLEDNLLEFDVEANRFGFTSSLLLQATTCSTLSIPGFSNNIKK